MINYFDILYTYVSSMRNVFIRKGLRFMVRVVVNMMMPTVYNLFCLRKYSLNFPENKKGRLIVSLTSFPERIGKLHIVCDSLLRQSQKPDLIVIWLSKLQFATLDILPIQLLNLQKRGVQIRLVDDDLRSHKKYYYVLSEFADDYIILVDDDIFYRSTMIEDLLKYHRENPLSIIVQYGRKIERKSGVLQSYEKWKQIKHIVPGKGDIFFGSGGGTFIPPHSFYKDVLCKELSLELTPNADDIWLNAMARLQGTEIVKTQYFSSNIELMYKKKKTLASINNASANNMNDFQLEKISRYYGNKLIW